MKKDKFAFIKNMLSTSNSVSLIRVLTFFVVADVMVVWTLECIKNVKMMDIPWGPVSIVGVMITGKFAQRFAEAEEKKNECDEPDGDLAPGKVEESRGGK